MSTLLYRDLKHEITNRPANHEALKELKLLFREDIRSNRTYDKIQTLSELITVLEKRDVLNEDNLHKLENIECVLDKHSPYSIKRRNRKSITTPTSIYPDVYVKSSRIQCNPKLKSKIYSTVASEIGRNWEQFGRCLGVPESGLDDIRDRNTRDKVYSILNFHEDNCDQRKWRSELLKALIDCRRMDLHDKIQFFFDTFIDE